MPIKGPAPARRVFPFLFWCPALLILGIVSLGIFQPTAFQHQVETLNQLIYTVFGSYYLWFTLGTLVLFLSIGISPLGRIRLGGSDAKAEYSLFSWFAMLFCAGMGTGLMFWGAAEPLFHYMNPPLATAVTTSEKIAWAFHYSFFHWGFHPWAIYGMTSLVIAFFGFNLNHGIHFSAFLQGRGRSVTGWRHGASQLIDLMTIVAIIFGIAATFGMGVLQLQGGLNTVFGITPTPLLTVSLVCGMTMTYLASALKGLKTGIKVLSDTSFWLYLVLLAVLISHSSHALLDDVVQHLPQFFARLPAMSLGLGQYRDPLWVGEWTVKYWSWWIAWAPFVGIFIALISKGRTVRELVFASVILPSVFSMLWFTLFGNAAISLQLQNAFFGSSLDLNQVNVVLFQLMDQLTHARWVPLLCLLIIALDFINSADGATYTIASLSSKSDNETPPGHVRFGWGILFAALTSLFLLTGGIHLLQQITLITALPFALLLSLIFVRLIPAMMDYRKKSQLVAEDSEKTLSEPVL